MARVDEWLDRTAGCLYSGYNSAVKRNGVRIDATTGFALKNLMLSESSQSQPILFDSTYMKCPEQGNLYRDKAG